MAPSPSRRRNSRGLVWPTSTALVLCIAIAIVTLLCLASLPLRVRGDTSWSLDLTGSGNDRDDVTRWSSAGEEEAGRTSQTIRIPAGPRTPGAAAPDALTYFVKGEESTPGQGSAGNNNAGTGVLNDENIPAGKTASVYWYADGSTFMFGGRTTGSLGPLDLWRFVHSTRQWMHVKTFPAGRVYGTRSAGDNTVSPGDAWNMASAVDADGTVWLYGGMDSASNPLGGLWSLDPTSNELTFRAGDETNANAAPLYPGGGAGTSQAGDTAGPGARISATMWAKDGVVYIYGGRSASDTYGDMWMYDADQWTWLHGPQNADYGNATDNPTVDTEGTPMHRYGAVGAVSSAGLLVLLGGEAKNRAGDADLSVSDAWSYNTGDNAWTFRKGPFAEVSVTGSDYGQFRVAEAASVMPGRSMAAYAVDSVADVVYVYAGLGKEDGNSFYLNDAWMLSLTTYEQTWVGGFSAKDAGGGSSYDANGAVEQYGLAGSGGIAVVDRAGGLWYGFGSDGSTFANDLFYLPSASPPLELELSTTAGSATIDSALGPEYVRKGTNWVELGLDPGSTQVFNFTVTDGGDTSEMYSLRLETVAALSSEKTATMAFTGNTSPPSVNADTDNATYTVVAPDGGSAIVGTLTLPDFAALRSTDSLEHTFQLPGAAAYSPRIYAEDGTFATYHFEVEEADVVDLLTWSGQLVADSFDSGVLAFNQTAVSRTFTFPWGQAGADASLFVELNTAESSFTVDGNAASSPYSFSLPAAGSEDTLTVRVTADNDTSSRDYSIVLQVEDAPDDPLAWSAQLAVGDFTEAVEFNETSLEHTFTAPFDYAGDEATLSFTVAEGANVTVNGAQVTSPYTLTLPAGGQEDSYDVTLHGANGNSTRDYTLRVRVLDDDGCVGPDCSGVIWAASLPLLATLAAAAWEAMRQ